MHPENVNGQRLIEIDDQLREIAKRLENIRDCVEKGLSLNFMSDRIENLESRRAQLENERRMLLSKKPHIDIHGIKEKILLTMDEFSIEIDQSQSKAICYIRKFPVDVKVYKCRRSESNRHDVAIGGF
jgi:hypothetical protein